jgi:TonB-linked SusC/RagA family outer membrane protein
MRHRLLLLLSCLFCAATLLAQKNISVSGTVMDENATPLADVTISVKAKKITTKTDANGRFKLEAAPNNVLVVTMVGYKENEVTVDNGENLVITLTRDLKAMEEVVVIGYGTVKKSSLTGSVSKVRNDNLDQIPVSRADIALQGKLAGVNIITTDAQAGAAPTIQIRGATSISATTNPLIVVDGYPVPTDLSTVDMNDIESIEVLKDAASAAIYGSRGGNGVILITTKMGRSGKTKINFNLYTGIKNTYRRLDLYNLDEWIDFVQKDTKGAPLSTQILTAEKFNANTYPQDIIFRQGSINNFSANVAGGTNTVKYFLSGGVSLDKGVVIKNNYQRYNLRANFSIKASPKFEIGIDISPTYSVTSDLPLKIHDAIRTIAQWMPLYANDTVVKYTGKPVGSYVHQRDFDPARNPMYAAFGFPSLSASSDNNGYTQIMGTDSKLYEFRTIANTFLKYDFTKSLSFKTSLGFFTSQRERELYRASWARVDILNPQTTAAQARANTFGQNTKTGIMDLLSENLLIYKKHFTVHDIDAIAGFTAQTTKGKRSDIQANNFATDEIKTLNAGTIIAASTTEETNNLVSALFRVNYGYKDKYLLSVASRWDGSSRFGPDNRWGWFPSASAAWRISQELFLQNSQWINELKLRASYGATGNNNIGNYRYFANVTPVNAVLGDNPSPGFVSSLYSNNNLGWERTFSFNGGIDASLWENRLSITLDGYNATTDKLLLYLPIPYVTGVDGYYINLGKVKNTGFELEVTGKIVDNKNFKWSTTVVGSHNRNKLIDFGGNTELISNGDPKRNNFFLARVGQPLVQFYGYVVDSAVSLSGSNYWPIGVAAERTFAKDINDDGVIDSKDRTTLGSPYPDFTWGMTQTFRYKDFDASFILQGSRGAEVYNVDPNYYETQFNSTGVNAYLKYSPALQATTRFKTESSYNVQDASFIALRSVNIGYNLPKKILNRLHVSNLRFYATANNLWYKFAGNYSSLNPEGINEFETDPLKKGYQRGAAPVTRTIAFGLNLGF